MRPAHVTSKRPEGIRAAIVADLRANGVADRAFEDVVAEVNVHDFVPLAFRDQVSADRSLPLECGQFMPAPALTARIVQSLEAEPNHSVLEIGTGSGYATALISRVARKVTTLERYRTLVHAASRRLAVNGMSNAAFLQRDGSVPHRDGIVYDRILIDSAFEQVPRHYIDMLAANGVLVCAVGPLDGEQQMLRLTKIGSRFDRQTLFPVRFGGLEKGVATAL